MRAICRTWRCRARRFRSVCGPTRRRSRTGALQQLRNVATLPWIKGLAVMPDVHYGKGATVGSVIAMRGAVCPAAVGVDIGCGMSAVKTSLTAERPARRPVPAAVEDRAGDSGGAGDARHRRRPGRLHGLRDRGWDDFWGRFDGVAEAVKFRQERRRRSRWERSDRGNHFIEVCLDTTDSVWLMLHSGSRNIGKELAEHHIGVAQKLPHNQGLVDRDLAVFVVGHPADGGVPERPVLGAGVRASTTARS